MYILLLLYLPHFSLERSLKRPDIKVLFDLYLFEVYPQT